VGEGVAGASARLEARLVARTSRQRSFFIEATGVESVREDACEEVRETAPVESNDAPAARRGLSEGRRPVLLEEPKAGIVRGRARKPLGDAPTEERTKTRRRISLHDAQLCCFGYRVCVPPNHSDARAKRGRLDV